MLSVRVHAHASHARPGGAHAVHPRMHARPTRYTTVLATTILKRAGVTQTAGVARDAARVAPAPRGSSRGRATPACGGRTGTVTDRVMRARGGAGVRRTRVQASGGLLGAHPSEKACSNTATPPKDGHHLRAADEQVSRRTDVRARGTREQRGTFAQECSTQKSRQPGKTNKQTNTYDGKRQV